MTPVDRPVDRPVDANQRVSSPSNQVAGRAGAVTV